jgi:hypothetical protein
MREVVRGRTRRLLKETIAAVGAAVELVNVKFRRRSITVAEIR